MNNENQKSIMLDPAEYENFKKYQKSIIIEEKRKEIRKTETKIANSRIKIKTLLDSENNLKQELQKLIKSK